MEELSFAINNQYVLELTQYKHDGTVFLTIFSKDVDGYYTEEEISSGDMVMLMNHYRNCKRYGLPIVPDDPEYFGHIRWSDADVEGALRESGIPTIDENCSRLRHFLENGHDFVDRQIEAGWNYIDYAIGYLFDGEEE